jgi:RNA polymerase sigma factor (sigma-70 family)
MELQELETSLHQAIDILPSKVQEVFRLRRFEGMTHEQIAKKLGISVVSSKTYIVRALQQHPRVHG